MREFAQTLKREFTSQGKQCTFLFGIVNGICHQRAQFNFNPKPSNDPNSYRCLLAVTFNKNREFELCFSNQSNFLKSTSLHCLCESKFWVHEVAPKKVCYKMDY